MKNAPTLIQRLGPHFLYKLYCFYFVVYWGNYRKAANHLNLSPSALSKMIQALEGRLQCRLLERKTRSSLRLTLDGTQVYAYSKELVESLEAFEQSLIQGQQPKRYTVCLAIPEWMGSDYFVETLQQFKRDHPECLLQLNTEVEEGRPAIHRDQIRISTSPHDSFKGISKPFVQLYFHCSASLWAEPCIQSLYQRLKRQALFNGEKKS